MWRKLNHILLCKKVNFDCLNCRHTLLLVSSCWLYMLHASDSQLIELLVWYYRWYDIFGNVHESYFEHNYGSIFKDYLDLLNVLRPPLILGYTGSMRMIDEDEVGLKEKP